MDRELERLGSATRCEGAEPFWIGLDASGMVVVVVRDRCTDNDASEDRIIIQREKDEKRGRVGGCGGEQCTGGMMGQREGGRGLGFIGRAARVAIAKEEGTSSVGDHLQI